MKIITLLGPQGSGKGTQAELLESLKFFHLDMGHELRQLAEKKTKEGQYIKEHLEKGLLVDDKITLKIFRKKLKEAEQKKLKGITLDGYPRNLKQYEAVKKTVKISLAIYLELDDKTAIERLSKRRVCSKCDHIYIYSKELAKKCLECGGKIIHREDDKPKAIRQRLKIYHEQTEPLLKEYEKQNILKKIDASKTIKQVFARVRKIVESF